MHVETLIEGPTTLYPGQQIDVGYRFSYNADIDLTTEILPLIEAPGFKKIGELRVDDQQEGTVSTRTIRQKIAAINKGTFEIAGGRLEGYLYLIGPEGKKQYITPSLQAETLATVLHVYPFPLTDQPSVFQGSLGQWKISSSLASGPSTVVGGKLVINVVWQGEGQTESLQLPTLCCQSGWSGFFKIENLGFIEPTRCQVALWPQIALEQIPPIHFASFDPFSGHYIVTESDPLTIHVHNSPLSPTPKEVLPTPTIKTGPLDSLYAEALTSKDPKKSLENALQTHIKEKNWFWAANDLFTLQEYPLAIGLYQRTLYQEPRHPFAFLNLQEAQKLLEVTRSAPPPFLSLSALHAFMWITILVWTSLFFLYGKRWVLALAIIPLYVASWSLYRHFIQPIPAIVIDGASLHQTADPEAPLVRKAPLRAGQQVFLIQLQGPWAKIRTEDGLLGYVEAKKLFK